MMKMELEEVRIILTIIENASFQGKDIPKIANLIEKLQKEMEKLAQ